MSKLNNSIAGLLAIFLSACGTPRPPLQLFEGESRSTAEISRIRVSDSQDYTGNRLSYDWISRVTSVDGRSTNGAGVIHVLPGKHKIKMSCEANPKYTEFQKVGNDEFEINLQPGQLYFPWCKKVVSGVITGQTRGALPGTTMSIEKAAFGRFSGYLDTRRVP